MLKITLKKSVIGATPGNRRTVQALGLGKTGRSVLQEDTPVIRGMIHHAKHLLTVEVVTEGVKVRKRQDPKAKAAAQVAKPKAVVVEKPKAEAVASEPKAKAPAKPKTVAPAEEKPKRTTKKKEDAN